VTSTSEQTATGATRTAAGAALGVVLGCGLLYCWLVQMWLWAVATVISVGVVAYVARTSPGWRRFIGAVLMGAVLTGVALFLALLAWGLAIGS
jgi:hypothetical protein